MSRYFKKRAPEPLTVNDEALQALSAAPPPQPSPPLKKTAGSRWRKSKKHVEQRPEVNLDLVLPTQDDLRTSLFMPALSARFSMLREQDDPHSKLGKASDDSVLQPRRRSRMDLALDDIAEVSSIKSSIRPPFAETSRQASFASEDGYFSEDTSSHGGSVMSRARPGEGNNLFGGRQRVYMIPKNGSASSRSGRAVYVDDLAVSPFQLYRRERQMQAARESNESEDHGFDFGLEQSDSGAQDERYPSSAMDSAKDLSHSPSLSSSDKKRSTNSTSHSDARSSTAATSVGSQPPTATTSPVKAFSPAPQPHQPLVTSAPAAQPLKRSDTKGRRLYEQGLDQHMHEQQSSAMNRLNSIHRQRGFSNRQAPMYLHGTKSTSNLQDRARQPVYALDAPSNTPLFGMYGPAGASSPNLAGPNASLPPTPLTAQPGMDMDEANALSQALEPADRGKATAMGAFNKPKQSFDEQQYLERQRQLQRSASNAVGRKDAVASASSFAPSDSNPSPNVESAPPESSRRRAMSKENMLSAVPETSLKDSLQRGGHAEEVPSDRAALPDPHRTFFGNISASDSEEDDEQPREIQNAFKMPDYGYGTQHGKWQPTILPAVTEHPALRSARSKPSLAGAEETSQLQPAQTADSLRMEPPTIQTTADEMESPVLGHETRQGTLNSLMHHLRQKSNVSSITQKSDTTSQIEPAELTSRNLDLVNRPIHSIAYSNSRVGSYAHSNPWDLEELDTTNIAKDRNSHVSISPVESEHHLAPFGSNTSSINRISAVSALDPEETEAEEGDEADAQGQHTRDTSTATQRDRDAFESVLAARRDTIRQNIMQKNNAERDTRSRGVSPAQSTGSARKAFGMLRQRSSRESLDATHAPEVPPVLAPMGSRPPTTGASMPQHQPRVPRAEADRMRERSISRPSPPNGQLPMAPRGERDALRLMHQPRSREDSESEPFPQANRPSPPASAGTRSRANSAATSGRSRSRTGPYRDDLEKAMVEGTGSSTATIPDLTGLGPRELTPRSTPDFSQGPFEPPRARSGSRANVTNYFESKSLQPLHTGSRERLSPRMPSPALTPNSYNSPPLTSPMPRSPAGSFAQNMTPPLSGQSTPMQFNFPQQAQLPPSSARPGGPLRKKTISKGDISEPTLISSTSNVELVDLPEGASLKNGMDEPPPVPPINPARRATKKILGIGRKESQDGIVGSGSWSNHSRRSPELDAALDVHPAYRNRSATLSSPQKRVVSPVFDQHAVPRQNGSGSPGAGSPSRLERSSPPTPAILDGAMF